MTFDERMTVTYPSNITLNLHKLDVNIIVKTENNIQGRRHGGDRGRPYHPLKKKERERKKEKMKQIEKK